MKSSDINVMWKNYRLKTGQIEEKVVNAYKKIEDGVVRGYKTVENAVVDTYKKIKGKFVETFLEEIPENNE